MPVRGPLRVRDDFVYSYEATGNWWYSPMANLVKWIIAFILVTLMIVFALSYYHAKRRMAQRLAPLPYHRWMVSRRRRAHFHQNAANQVGYYRGEDGELGLKAYPHPPPVYDEAHPLPPSYQPREANSSTEIFAPPSGPPPEITVSAPEHAEPIASPLPTAKPLSKERKA